uniref:Mucin 1, cell surface associated n=1 Tax=Homo sapiens TaxID=9606 RepID=A0A087WWM2_HUMAN
MTPGTQSPFFLLLLLTVLTATTAPKPATVVTGSGHASSTPGGEKETSATQRSSVPSSTEKNAALHQAQLLLWCTTAPLPGLPQPQPARALHSQFPATTLILLPPLPAIAPRLMPVALTIARSQHRLLPRAAERHF